MVRHRTENDNLSPVPKFKWSEVDKQDGWRYIEVATMHSWLANPADLVHFATWVSFHTSPVFSRGSGKPLSPPRSSPSVGCAFSTKKGSHSYCPTPQSGPPHPFILSECNLVGFLAAIQPIHAIHGSNITHPTAKNTHAGCSTC